MPHFDEYGGDEWICQICGRVHDSTVKSVWNSKATGNVTAGNVCPRCMRAFDETGLTGDRLREYVRGPMSLAEHCRRESGGLTGEALRQYMNRYYGTG